MNDLRNEEIYGTFSQKQMQKTDDKEIKQMISCLLSGQVKEVLLIVGLIRKILHTRRVDIFLTCMKFLKLEF